MRLEERRMIVGLLIAGAIGAVLFFPGVYFVGLWLAPPRPIPDSTAAPPLILDALWARADGGRATELRPVNPINIVQQRVCRALAARQEDPQVRASRRAECLKQLPAIQAVDYLSGVHMRDNQMNPQSIRTDWSQFATAVWVTRSWTKEEFLNTLATRGQFGFDWRGVHAAARGYFDREPADLTLPQAALMASRVGEGRGDPWCEPEAAIEMRNRILTRMRENGVISETDYQQASTAPLELGPRPNDSRCADERAR